MPYEIKKLPTGQYARVRKADGKVVARHATKAKAEAAIRAVYANEGAPQK